MYIRPFANYFLEKKNYKNLNKKIIYILILILPFIDIKEILNQILLKYHLIASTYLNGYYSTKQTYMAVFYSIFFLVVILVLDSKLKKVKNYIFLKKIYIYSIFIGNVLFYYGAISGRLSSFFNIEFLLQDKILKIIKNKLIVKFFMILFLIFLYKINVVNRLENVLLER